MIGRKAAEFDVEESERRQSHDMAEDACQLPKSSEASARRIEPSRHICGGRFYVDSAQLPMHMRTMGFDVNDIMYY